MHKKHETNPRRAAHASLCAWEKQGRFANLEVHVSLSASPLTENDRALYTALVYGVIERAITLDHIITQYSARPLDTIDPETRCALRLGLYQLTFMDRIPPHAAVSETVALAPARSRGFVNALLRTYLRAERQYSLPTDPLSRMSIEFGAPEPLCRFWLERYGEEETRQLLASTIRNPSAALRIHEAKISVEEVIDRHAADGARRCPLSPDMVLLNSAANIADGIREGLYFVQDPASRLTVRILDPQPGETVIDTCAAPGGKTLSAALDMQNQGRIVAFDLHENKLSLIRRAAEQLSVSILETDARDAREPDTNLIGTADRVLCDAPCSGLGVIGKKPDIKYKSLDSIVALPSVQYDILCGASKYVRPGGVLVYSTCTLNPDENEHVVRRFLAEHEDFAPAAFDLGAAGTSVDGMHTFLPHREGCDGFFAAKMIRKTV